MPDPQNEVLDANKQKLSWLSHQDAASKIDTSGLSTRGINAQAILLRAMWHLRELGQYGDKIVEPFNADAKKRYNDAFKALPSKLEALLYASTEYGTQRLEIPGVATEKLQQLDKRGKALEDAGMFWLKVLVQLGKVSKQRVSAIEAGSGYMDRAADLAGISELLDTHWKQLAPMIQSAEADAKVITRAELVEMNQISIQISDLIVSRRAAESVPGVDWKQQYLGCFVLCDRDWEVVRTSARFYFDRVQDKASHRSLIALRAMRTFQLRP
jgi:hypothetical protein